MPEWFTLFHLIYNPALLPPVNTYPRLFIAACCVTASMFFFYAIISLLINSDKDVRQAVRCENSRNAGRALALTLFILLTGNYGGMLILAGCAIGVCYLLSMLVKGIFVSIGSCRRKAS